MEHISQPARATNFTSLAKKVLLNRKLNAITDCKNQLSLKISHELNTPLNEIFCIVNKLRSELLTENQQNCLNNIHEATIDLLTLLNHFLSSYQQSAPETQPIDNDKNKLTVLLVEDDPIVQRVHSMMLKKMGFNVEIAANGYQAIDLSNKHYDAILMDIGLPDMDGITTSLTIRQQKEKNSSTPIIALTAYGDDVKQECLSVGINEVATKPIKQEELNEILLKWINI